MKKSGLNQKLTMAGILVALLSQQVHAGEDMKVLLELLLEKGVITREEYDNKLKKVAELEEIKEFNQAQDIRKSSENLAKRAEQERKFKTQIYGQASAGYYSASNMTSSNLDASGMSDQPKGNNRIGLKISQELDADVTAMMTVESNFSTRTGAVGRDSAGYGQANSGGTSNVGASLFDREANFRLSSKQYGTVIIGRGPNLQNDLSGAFDSRQNWNFGGLKSIGRYAGFHSASGINRADKLIRYISPVLNGFNADVGVSFGGVADNDEKGTNYYLGGRYKNGNFEMGYNHAEVRLGSASAPTSQTNVNNRVDFIAAKYSINQLTVNTGYVITRNPTTTQNFDITKTAGAVDANTVFAGAVYRFTSALSWNGAYYHVQDRSPQSASNKNNDVRMFATGLTWSPYKEWDFFVDYVRAIREGDATGAFTIYDKWKPDTGSSSTTGFSESQKNQSGISLGAQYKF
jgi:predicted porin